MSISIADLQQECINHMAENGLAPSEPIMTDGKIHRYSIDSKKNKPDEWYVAHEATSPSGYQYLNCTYGTYSGSKGQLRYDYKSFEKSKLSYEEKKELREEWKKNQQEVERQIKIKHDNAAVDADKLWEESANESPSDEYLAYINAKGIKPSLLSIKYGHNPKRYSSIIIPLRNIDGAIRSLQFISMGSGKSYKSFFTGGEVQGNFHTLGTIVDGQPIIIVEGFATGASVHEATGQTTVVAFSAHNLKNVIPNLKKRYPSSSITIAGDSDEAGRKAAEETAKISGCKIVFPTFPESKRKDLNDPDGKDYKDFNDLHKVSDLEEVKHQIAKAITVKSAQEELSNLAHNLLIKEEPCSNFSLSCLPPILRDYVEDICQTTSAHPIMVTSSVISTVSAYVGRRLYIPEGEDGYFQTLYPNVWILCVTKSGQFKTTALSKGAKRAWEESRKANDQIRCLKEELKNESNPQNQKDIKDKILEASLKDIILPQKMTTEAFLQHLSEGHRGVLLSSEFAAYLQNMDKSHNNDYKALSTDLYDIPQSYRYKTKTQGDLILNSPFYSICGVSTLAWLRSSLKRDDVSSGFFARFLLFAPPHDESIPPALPQPKKVINKYAEEQFNDVLDNMDDEYNYRLSDEAKILFKDLHETIYKIQREHSDRCREILEPFVKRWSPYLLKIAMLMQLFINPEKKEIGTAALLAALNFLMPAIKSTAHLFEGELGESEHERKCRIVYEWICKKIKKDKEPVVWREIIVSHTLGGGSKEYEEIVTTLVEQGKLTKIDKYPKSECEYTPIKSRG
jgi:putative DNA primase/helicase